MNNSTLRQTLDSLQIPYLLLDWDWNILWSNLCLKIQYPFLSTLRSLDLLLYGYDREKIMQRLLHKQESVTLACKLPLMELSFTLTALQSSDVLVSIQHPNHDSDESDGSALSPLERSIRRSTESILATLGYLQRRLDEEYSHELDSMARDCYQLLRTCYSVGEYNDCLHGRCQLERQYEDMGAWLHQQMDPLLPTLQRMGIEVIFQLPPQPLYLSFDSSKLSVVLFSLVSNSCLYGESKNCIRITLLSGDHQARILISDEGHGIPTDILPQVMEPYFSYRIDRPANGLGLGLPLCKALIEQHGGSLALQSMQDHGTTVAISLPRSLPSASGGVLQSPPAPYRPERYPMRTIFLSTVLPPEELQ